MIQNNFGERNVKNENLTDRRSDEPSCRVVQLDQVPDEEDGGDQEQDRRYDRIDSFLKTTFDQECGLVPQWHRIMNRALRRDEV